MAESNLIRLSGLWAHEQEDGSLVLTGNLGCGAADTGQGFVQIAGLCALYWAR